MPTPSDDNSAEQNAPFNFTDDDLQAGVQGVRKWALTQVVHKFGFTVNVGEEITDAQLADAVRAAFAEIEQSRNSPSV